MHERLMLIEHAIEFILVFTAVGSGPAIGLIRDRRIQLVAMPILGFALSASLLTTIARFLPMATATWVVLVPAAVISPVAAVVLARRRPATGRAREIAVPAAVFVIGVVLALAPPLVRGAQGPYALGVFDAWAYTETSEYLQHHHVGETLPAEVARTDLTTWNGSAVNGVGRIGVDAIDASAATLFRAEPAELLAPFLAVLFGLFSLVIWLLVRGFGGSWQAAALGSTLGLTPAVLTMVVDTTLGNIAAEILAPPALFFLMRSLKGESVADTERKRESIADAVVAGVLLGGLVAVYSEYLPPELIVATCCVLVLAIDQARRGAFRNWVWLGVSRIGIAIVTAIVIAPHAVYRAYYFLLARSDDGAWALSLPGRAIDVENVGSWVFGLHHLYALSTFSTQSALHLGFSIYFPVVLAAAVLVGIAQLRISGVFVAAPVFVGVALGLFAYHSYQLGHCEYCLWKSLTFMIPFITVGLAFGFERLWQGGGARNLVFLQRGILVSVAVLALAAIANSDVRLVQNTLSGGAFCRCGGWWSDLGKRLDRLPSQSPLLIEGTDTIPHNTFALNAAYFGARGNKRTIWFDAGFPTIAYLVPTEAAPAWYSPDYEYVLTPFEDVRSNRTPLGRFGPLVLERRAPIDVVVSANGWITENTGIRIPRGATPFKLRVSSKRAMDAAITLALARPAGSGSTLELRSEGLQLEAVAANRSEICVNVHLNRGRTIIDATPVLNPLAATTLPNEFGIAAVEAAPGRCGKGPSASPLSFYDGWFPLEQNADGSYFRWMSSVGTVEVGTPGVPRSSVRIDAQARSFVRRRRVDVMLGEKRLASFEVPEARPTKITVVVPAGQGVARLLFVAVPAAESASIVTPADVRLLSVGFSRVSIRSGVPTSKQP